MRNGKQDLKILQEIEAAGGRERSGQPQHYRVLASTGRGRRPCGMRSLATTITVVSYADSGDALMRALAI